MSKRIRRGLSVLAVAVSLGIILSMIFITADTGITSAQGAEFLQEEAGPAMYMNAGHTLDLSKAKDALRNVEVETATYIIGSMALPSLPSEDEDVHCYVHVDGWIVVYYLKTEPLAKIVSNAYWSGDKLAGTKLDEGMTKICDALQEFPVNVKKYHFQHPNANNWEIVAKYGDTFSINVPSEFMVYERSWYSSHHVSLPDRWRFYLDGEMIESNIDHGVLSPSELLPDEYHIVGMIGNNHLWAICLVYQEP